jgi:hypothetical protein
MGDRVSRLIAVSLALLLGVGVSACSGGGEGEIPANVSQERLDPKDFPTSRPRSDRGRKPSGGNPYLPLEPGMQWVREGRVTVGDRRLSHRIVYTVTDLTKEINGVRAKVVLDQDFNGGELAEQALDFLAEDKRGNVWYLGSYTETYEGGEFVNATDGWLTGLNGARSGILMKARPKKGMSYLEATVPGEGAAVSEVIKTGQSKCVPFDCYEDVVVIQEGPDSGAEYKYYAPDVGHILTEPHYSGGDQETELLMNFTQLSPRGVAEMSKEALRVDRHARVVIPDVFNRAPAAKRAG